MLAAQAAAHVARAPTVGAIGGAAASALVACADETGMRTSEALCWIHALTTPTLTHLSAQSRRGTEGMLHAGMLSKFKGTLVHDGWAAYFKLDGKHALCNAHRLRELRFLEEQLGMGWAPKVAAILREGCSKAHRARALGLTINPDVAADLMGRYGKALAEARLETPAPAKGSRGQARCLLDRLTKHAQEVWAFSLDSDVPFTNNLAERAMRMLKVKPKVSGTFRTRRGLEAFCCIRSYLDTLQKQGSKIFESLCEAMAGRVPQPAF